MALLLLAMRPVLADDTKPLTAILLVARAELPDPDFTDSVVLVMNNLAPGPVGIILNRPTPLAVAELFPRLKHLARQPDKVYFGGPVELKSIWFLFRASIPPKQAIQVLDGVYLGADQNLLLRLLGRDKPMEGLRIFMGHAGWMPGQLEAEIDRNDWTLKRAEPGAIFNGQSDRPWNGSEGTTAALEGRESPPRSVPALH